MKDHMETYYAGANLPASAAHDPIFQKSLVCQTIATLYERLAEDHLIPDLSTLHLEVVDRLRDLKAPQAYQIWATVKAVPAPWKDPE